MVCLCVWESRGQNTVGCSFQGLHLSFQGRRRHGAGGRRGWSSETTVSRGWIKHLSISSQLLLLHLFCSFANYHMSAMRRHEASAVEIELRTICLYSLRTETEELNGMGKKRGKT